MSQEKKTCPACLATVPIKADGSLTVHLKPKSNVFCPYGPRPKNSGKNVDREERRSIKTVSGGLPTLGKR